MSAGKIWYRELFVNKTRDYIFGESDITESDYTVPELGKMFQLLQAEYGRCDSKVYVDSKEGSIACGWMFTKRMRYDDARPGDKDGTYIREVWVHLYDGPVRHVMPTSLAI